MYSHASVDKQDITSKQLSSTLYEVWSTRLSSNARAIYIKWRSWKPIQNSITLLKLNANVITTSRHLHQQNRYPPIWPLDTLPPEALPPASDCSTCFLPLDISPKTAGRTPGHIFTFVWFSTTRKIQEYVRTSIVVFWKLKALEQSHTSF